MNLYPKNKVESVNGRRGRVIVQEDRHVLFIQDIPSDTWTIQHNMGKIPTITVMDSGGNKVLVDEEHVDENLVILRSIGAHTGKATLN